MPDLRVQRAALTTAAGIVMLAMWVGPSLAQPDAPLDHSSRVALPAHDGPITAQAAPLASIAAPSAAIGDFGASQGGVWDMDSITDIVWTQSDASGRTIKLSQPAPGIVRGRTPEGSDLAIAFYTSSTTNLPSSQYHHLTFKLYVAPEGNCRTDGRIIYARSWPNWLGSQEYTYGFLPHEPPMNCPPGQWCVYYMDLSSNKNDIIGPDTATWFKNPPPWPKDTVKAFGMWPHEKWNPKAGCSGGPNYFDMDFVYLTGDIVAREKDGYTYTIKWNVSDPDGGTVTSVLRYRQVSELLLPSQSPVCNSGNFETEWTYIGEKSIDLSPAPSYPNKIFLPVVLGGAGGGTAGLYNQTYVWDLSDPGFLDGMSYYVCIRVDDGTSQTYAVSSAPVVRVPLSPNFGSQ